MGTIFIRAPVVQAYGLTETCAGAAFSDYDDISVGRVGPPLPCCFVKVNLVLHMSTNIYVLLYNIFHSKEAFDSDHILLDLLVFYANMTSTLLIFVFNICFYILFYLQPTFTFVQTKVRTVANSTIWAKSSVINIFRYVAACFLGRRGVFNIQQTNASRRNCSWRRLRN